MSELINNSKYRKKRLKELILKLHEGESPRQVRQELTSALTQIPYGEVVEVEQELILEGLPEEEVLKLCDIHGEVLEGNIDLSTSKTAEEGHPVDIFKKENEALLNEIRNAEDLFSAIDQQQEDGFRDYVLSLQGIFNQLMDVDKHYQRKEYLVFPYLEKNEITGPPKVMWGKHDEIREQLKGCNEILKTPELRNTDLKDALELVFFPALKALKDMVQKEEEILFPMCLDELTTEDWWNIHKQTMEIGFAIIDPRMEWKPEGISEKDHQVHLSAENGKVQLPSGSFEPAELMAILNTVPVDMTFVDKHDKVKYFTQGTHRIFARSRSIINRDVRLCHPPGSVHVVEKILEDFKAGRASHAPFWIQLRGQFVHIEYFALRDENGEYLGTLEVSQELTGLRKLEGEKRILSYTDEKKEESNG